MGSTLREVLLMLRYAALIVAALLAGWSGNTGMTLPQPQVAGQLASASGADVSPATPSPTAARLYVANVKNCTPSGRCRGVNRITIYDAGANGNVGPIARIKGSNTALNEPDAVDVDAHRNIYVANFSGGVSKDGSVTVYAAGANGNVAPIRTIAGSNTGLDTPWSMALDASGKVYVTNRASVVRKYDSVTVYAAGANGNVAPIQTIAGSNTGLHTPSDIALDASGNIYVTNGYSVNIYGAGANGNVEPIRTISGALAGLDSAEGITVGVSGKVYVTNHFGGGLGCFGSVTVYAAGANGNIPPVQTICGKLTRMGAPSGVALDAAAHIYVLNESGRVTVFPADANGDLVPMRTISGPRTEIYAPRGFAVH